MAEVMIGAVAGAAVGAAFNELVDVVKCAVSQMVWCKKYCKDLEHDLLSIVGPIVTEICLNVQLPAREWEQPLFDLKEKLETGKSRVESCLELRRWSLIQKYRSSRAILKLRKDILQHSQNLPALNTLQLQQIASSLQDVREQQDVGQESMMGELKSIKATIADLGMTQFIADSGTPQLAGASHNKSTNDERLRKQLDELVQEDDFLVGLDN